MSVRTTITALIALAALGGPLAAQASADDGAPPTDDSAKAAAGWLARQMVDGEHFESNVGGTIYPDQGLTADAVIAFDSASVSQDFAARATTWLAKPDILSGYIGNGSTELYAGAHAKLIIVAAAQQQDPASFGGVDLPARLLSLQAPSGRFSDKSAFGDYSNGISQSLAVIGLTRVTGAAPTASVDFLAGSQCPDGGFPLNFAQALCTSDTDVTGFAVQAMLSAGRTDNANKALDYLQKVQKDDGGFAGTGPTAEENANSTALAAQALRVAGRDEAADLAVNYLTTLQVGCDGPQEQWGAVAYHAAGFGPATANRATAQAVTGITGFGLAVIDNGDAGSEAPILTCGE